MFRSPILKERSGDMDFVIIETSGVCDPVPVLATLEQLEDNSCASHVDSVLAVVDASALTGVTVAKGAAALGLQDKFCLGLVGLVSSLCFPDRWELHVRNPSLGGSVRHTRWFTPPRVLNRRFRWM